MTCSIRWMNADSNIKSEYIRRQGSAAGRRAAMAGEEDDANRINKDNAYQNDVDRSLWNVMRS